MNSSIIPSNTKFNRKTYFEELFNSYILPWNCHDKLAKRQNYLYTHRYKAVLGFDFSYTMRGAQFPEFENTGVAGIGFFSSFGETSWIILESTDPRVDIRGGAKRVLPWQLTPNGHFFHYYNGIYYNRPNSLADQTNNLALHYTENIFRNIVNFDRGVQSYLEQTYWQHRAPGHWDSIRLSPGVPAVLSIKPCARADSFIEFFSERGHWTTKLNFFSSSSYSFFRPFSGVFGSQYLRSKLLLRHLRRKAKSYKKTARLLKKLIKKKKWVGLSRTQAANAINVLFELPGPLPSRETRPHTLFNPFLKSRLYFNNLYRRMNFFKLRQVSSDERRAPRRKRSKIEKKIRPSAAIRSILKKQSNFYHSPRFNASLYTYLPLKGASLFLSWRYARKKRRNRRVWYCRTWPQYRDPSATRLAIRYHKSYKKRKFIFAF